MCCVGLGETIEAISYDKVVVLVGIELFAWLVIIKDIGASIRPLVDPCSYIIATMAASGRSYIYHLAW